MNYIQKNISIPIYILVIFAVISCKKSTQENETKTAKKETNASEIQTKQDSIIITTELGDTLKYSKKTLKISKTPILSFPKKFLEIRIKRILTEMIKNSLEVKQGKILITSCTLTF